MLTAERAGEAFAQLGFGALPEAVAQAVRRLVEWAEPEEGGFRLSPGSFEVSEFPAACDLRDVAERKRVIRWLERLDLVHPASRSDPGLRLAGWLVEVTGALGG